MTIAFGPIPSRPRGRSLGVNNIPPKRCSYSCVYCQLGATKGTMIEPRTFYPSEEVVQAVTERVEKVRVMGDVIDYLTFVPDGEPALDVNLDTTIERLRPLGIRIAVITNASLVWHKEICTALSRADWVSLKRVMSLPSPVT